MEEDFLSLVFTIYFLTINLIYLKNGEEDK